MMRSRPFNLREDRFGRIARWILFFVAILAALWLTTQSNTAPQLILLVLVYVIVINFSIPQSVGYITIAPLVAIVSFWTLDFEASVVTALVGLSLAEILSPIWQPLRRTVASGPVNWRQRIFQALALFATIVLTGLLFRKQIAEPSLAVTWTS